MRFQTFNIRFTDLLNCVFRAIELVSPAIAHHHSQVAYITQRICGSLGMNKEETVVITLAAGLHDIGAISLEESIDDLRFEKDYKHEHSAVGALLLERYPPLANLAPLIKHHHKHYQPAVQQTTKEKQVPFGSYIIYLADRVSVLINENENVLSQQQKIINYMKKKQGTVFHPECVDAFLEIVKPEYFLLDVISRSTQDVCAFLFQEKTVKLNEKEVLDWAKLLARLVDFRSPFNAGHSSGVAASAAALAGLTRFSEQECHIMAVAGYLHDLGKLSVPTAVLEKNGPLNAYEKALVKGHAYYTYRILEEVKEFDTLIRWAAFHHERLDGTGYPFKITEPGLALGSQILTVADIFTALNEERTYRPALERNKIFNIMYKMARERAINGDLVRLLEKNYELVNETSKISQRESAKEYAVMNPFFTG